MKVDIDEKNITSSVTPFLMVSNEDDSIIYVTKVNIKEGSIDGVILDPGTKELKQGFCFTDWVVGRYELFKGSVKLEN